MKWKRLSIAVIIIGLLALTVFLWSRPKNAEMRIVEIPNTHCFATTNSTDYRYYFISDSDESLDAIESLLENFMDEHKDEIKSYMESKACIAWLFFRETRLINENWVEGGGYFQEDYIEWHKDDVIASLYASDWEIAYSVMNRSDGLFSYGDVLEERRYVGWILQDGTVLPKEVDSPQQPLAPNDTPLPSEPPLQTDTGEMIPWTPIIVGDPMDLAWDVTISPGNGSDQYSIQAYQSEGEAALTTKLVLVNADGIALQTIELDDCTPFVSTDNMPYLEDLNMDTYADLVVPTCGTLNQCYRFFAWIPTQGLFEPVEIISGADSTNCITYYEVNDGYISAWAKENAYKTYYREYIWLDIKTLSLNNEELILLEETEEEEQENR